MYFPVVLRVSFMHTGTAFPSILQNAQVRTLVEAVVHQSTEFRITNSCGVCFGRYAWVESLRGGSAAIGLVEMMIVPVGRLD